LRKVVIYTSFVSASTFIDSVVSCIDEDFKMIITGGVENARLENPAPNHRGGKRGTGKRGNVKVMESRRCRKCAT